MLCRYHPELIQAEWSVEGCLLSGLRSQGDLPVSGEIKGADITGGLQPLQKFVNPLHWGMRQTLISH